MSQNRATPRWVKVSGVIVIVLVVLIGILHLTGRSLGSHIPTRTPTIEVQQP